MASGGTSRNLIAEIRKKKRLLLNCGEQISDNAANFLVSELRANTPGPDKNPLNTGTLLKAITQKTRPKKVRSGVWVVGVGNLKKLGSSGTNAPRNTIRDFLNDHRGPYEAELAKKQQEWDKRRLEEIKAEEAAKRAAREARHKAKLERRRAEKRRKAERKIEKIANEIADINQSLNYVNDRIDNVEKQYKILWDTEVRLNPPKQRKGEAEKTWQERVDAYNQRKVKRQQRMDITRKRLDSYQARRRELLERKRKLERREDRLATALGY